MVSTIGSRMSIFAITIWAWELTGKATALALVGFFFFVPSILSALLAGVIVDRVNRKFLMVLSDTGTALSTSVLLLLELTSNLQIWHIYAIAAVIGFFSQIQMLAYQVSMTLIVPQQHYTRASSMGSVVDYGAEIIAPALAGSLYPFIGLAGIFLIDLASFTVAIATVICVHIPQPTHTGAFNQNRGKLWQEIAFGFSYIFTRSSLLALLVATSLFWFAHDLGESIYNPMILARTGGNAGVLGSVTSAAGFGGVTGAVIVSIWGGPKRRISGLFLGMMGAGVSKTIFGLGWMPSIWIPAQFCSSLNFPLLSSSNTAIWLAKIDPNMQGRVFAAISLIKQVVAAISTLIAGPLADRVFEPAMMPQGILAPRLGFIFGSEPGAGMALLYVITSVCLLLVGIGGYAFPTLRNVDEIVPNHDQPLRS